MRTIIVSDALFVFVHQIEDADGMWPAAPVLQKQKNANATITITIIITIHQYRVAGGRRSEVKVV